MPALFFSFDDSFNLFFILGYRVYLLLKKIDGWIQNRTIELMGKKKEGKKRKLKVRGVNIFLLLYSFTVRRFVGGMYLCTVYVIRYDFC